MFDYLIVGCGLSGVTAGRILAENGNKVLIIDKRNHVGGNVYDYYNEAGILIHKYGPHIFHTNSKQVFDFLSRFTKWRLYQHRVLSCVDGKLVPMPINLDTINMLYGTNYSYNNIGEFYENLKNDSMDIKNAKDMVVSKVGEELYEKFFKNYTKKQWNIDAEDLESEVTARIPIRYNRDDRYFADKYQAMPLNGYTEMVNNMLDCEGIHVMLNTSYEQIKDEVKYKKLIFTGCADEFFGYKYGRLPYRSIRFEEETLQSEQYQPVGTVNYPNDYDFTRITEYKYLTGQKCPNTTIMKEYSCGEGEPYYPIPQSANKQLYEKYAKEASKLENVYFLGRLGQYRYMNMDAVILNAINFINSTLL
ncbi:UDP-galactopyranose mutase [Clostridium oryzae]|uniref:UDP-galactopyranose mutase n=1 Tax=Clostridium oryzae TaxID=1450648 RepID=A0A1V4ITQ5_9CLOT|nr:UDP-galactopyranose mutase [Clostridium oryzae]OPJ63289.1 UDP-galactopyranose mutase precursor [Clostridium oryzae]